MSTFPEKKRAPRNGTLFLTDMDRRRLDRELTRTLPTHRMEYPIEGIIHGDYRDWLEVLPRSFVDVLILDPPYNLDKTFNGRSYSRISTDEYTESLDSLFVSIKPLLKPTSSIYICGDWLTSVSIYQAAAEHFIVRNRITWEREKGRGAKSNWKNSSEDIWFCTVSKSYTFNVDQVKLRRKVLAPYTHPNGDPKDWERTSSGNFRDTHPSNIWTDIVVPFWSMRENTDHPAQKSEKLVAKLVLASSNEGDIILDPFLGSGTTLAVAKKLNRRCLGIELDEEYCLLAARRLELAEVAGEIQGFADGVFWERHASVLITRARSSDQ